MAVWKYSLEVTSKELELVKKKKQALDNLFTVSKISQSTYDYLNKDLTDAITEIEIHQKTLADKITARGNDLEKQLKSLEIFFANLEIHFTAGEIDEELYKQQSNAVNLGIEATKQELMNISGALGEFLSEAETLLTPSASTEDASQEEKIEEQAELTFGESQEERVEEYATGEEAPTVYAETYKENELD